MTIEFKDLPRGIPNSHSEEDQAPRALWLDPIALSQDAKWQYKEDKVLLGLANEQVVGLSDDRHLLTIAGSRSGKGTSAIVPNLLAYPGSVVVIDPKGENARLTAERRGLGRGIEAGGLGHDVFVIDPFKVSGVDEEYLAGFNPLTDLNPFSDDFIDECDAIADALVVQEGGGDNAYFYDAARLVLRGYIAWVVGHADIKDKSLNEVKRLLFLPRKPNKPFPDELDLNAADLTFEHLSTIMGFDPNFIHGIPFEAAMTLQSMGDREFGSVMSTIRQQIGFISSPPMSRVLADKSRSPDLSAWKHGNQSVYLCLPAGRMHRHFRMFRLFINRLLNAIEADEAKPEVPALMILDEMHVLGHMKSLETAAGLIAGFGVRIWSFFQDLSQLKSIYGERWETFLGNSGVFQTFGLNDLGTLQYVSDRLGQSAMLKVSQSEVSRSQIASGFSGASQSIDAAPLLAPDEIAAFFSRQSGNQLIIYPGVSGIFIQRLPYTDVYFEEMRGESDA
ncbi:MAG: type IV secretory system conjugative DNA transfer family protein [Cognatishimia sp.]